MPIPTPLSHKQRSARRAALAKEVRSAIRADKLTDPGDINAAVSEIAAKHNITVAMVRNACREHGVDLPRKPALTLPHATKSKTFRIVAELMEKPAKRSGRSQADIAREYKLTRERVRAIEEVAVEAGVLEK